jgi:hypothetical protein
VEVKNAEREQEVEDRLMEQEEEYSRSQYASTTQINDGEFYYGMSHL